MTFLLNTVKRISFNRRAGRNYIYFITTTIVILTISPNIQGSMAANAKNTLKDLLNYIKGRIILVLFFRQKGFMKPISYKLKMFPYLNHYFKENVTELIPAITTGDCEFLEKDRLPVFNKEGKFSD